MSEMLTLAERLIAQAGGFTHLPVGVQGAAAILAVVLVHGTVSVVRIILRIWKMLLFAAVAGAAALVLLLHGLPR